MTQPTPSVARAPKPPLAVVPAAAPDSSVPTVTQPSRFTPRGARPVLVAVAHGSRDPRALPAVRALLSLVAAARPGLDVRLGHIELNEPLLDDTLAELHGDVILVPLLLSRGHHVKVDLPAALTRATHLRGAVSAPLGPHPLLAETLHARLAEAGWRSRPGGARAAGGRPGGERQDGGRPDAGRDAVARPGDVERADDEGLRGGRPGGPGIDIGCGSGSGSASGTPWPDGPGADLAGPRPDGHLPGEAPASSDGAPRVPSAVVLAAAGSRDPEAAVDAARTAALLSARLGGVPVVPGYASAAEPSVAGAVAALTAAGHPPEGIALASYFTAPGRFATQSAAAAPAGPAAPLGPHQAMAALVLLRYDRCAAAFDLRSPRAG